jgi:16S rRNA (guanine527-N7)-methyltransferase
MLEIVAAGAARLGIALSAEQRDVLGRYVALLLERNQRLNLTRIVEPAEVERRHLLDSLTCGLPCLDELRRGTVERCVDVGSGGGLPGIPLAVAFPGLHVTLVESAGKKAAFLREAVDRLGLERVSVRAERAEEAARDPDARDGYALVVARALAPLDVALELCLPFARPGGIVVLPRGSDLAAQLAAGEIAAEELAARLRPPIPLDLPELPPGRSLVVADKLGPTPDRYPRRPGMAAKRRDRRQETGDRSQESGVRRGCRRLRPEIGPTTWQPGPFCLLCTDSCLLAYPAPRGRPTPDLRLLPLLQRRRHDRLDGHGGAGRPPRARG